MGLFAKKKEKSIYDIDFVKPPCTHVNQTDLTHGRGDDPNIICHDCGWHLYKGKEWTEKEWDDYVNDMDGEPYKPTSYFNFNNK